MEQFFYGHKVMEENLSIFFAIVFLSMTVEHATSPICAKGAFLSFFHHILTTFIFLSPFFFKEYKVQLGLVLLVLIGQKNIGHCITSIKYNEVCNKNPTLRFQNPTEILKKVTNLEWDYIIGVPVVIFSVYNIWKHSS